MNENSPYPPIRDEELVVGALLGNMQAFDALVRRFRGAVIFVAQQTLGSREAAEDVAQEAFLLAYKALPQLQDPAKFAGWLYAITRHRARRVGTRERRSEAIEPSQMDYLILAQSPALTAHPAEEYAQQCEHAHLNAALAQLPEDYQTALYLYYYEDWPVVRIAEFLLLPQTTVKWRLHHGRDLLRRQLTRPTKGISDERLQPQQRQPAADAPHAARPRRAGPPRQHHRLPETGQAQRDAALQRDPGFSGTEQLCPARPVPDSLGGGQL